MSKTSGGQASTSKVHNNGEQRATEAAKKDKLYFPKLFLEIEAYLSFR